MKKFLVGIILTICLACCGALTACNTQQNGTYYDLTYARVSGVTFVSEVKSGAKVLEGYEVKFSITLDQDVVGTASVYANDVLLTANAQGEYSFVMQKDTVITVSGVEKQTWHTVTFDKGSDRIVFESEDGDTEEGFSVTKGSTVSFTVNVSSYYKDEYEVSANTAFITPDQNGVYTITVTEDTTVKVYGTGAGGALEQEDNFTIRANGGNGTASNPFKISKPIDLFYMAYLVNDPWYAGSGYDYAYYELTNDIDLEGEQMFIIGDYSDESAFFSGNFNGNGHTISNFYIDPIKMDESTSYAKVFSPYIGMFGYAVSTTDSAPAIYNLNLDNFTIDVDAAQAGSMFAVGGIVGVGIGANVTACSVTNATITADADFGYFGYMGGIAGVLQSAYVAEYELRTYAGIRSCYTDADIESLSGYTYAAGGIVGYLMSYEERTNAFVLNSYSTGNTVGACNTGGIAGLVSGDASVIGCYSTGNADATTNIQTTGSDEADVYAYAYAGGIAGFVDYNSVVSSCFATGDVFAWSTNGSAYAFYGDVVGATNQAGSPVIDSRAAIVLDCYGFSDEVDFTNEFLKSTLNWHEADWEFSENGYPTINYSDAEKRFTVTVDFGDKRVNGSSTATTEINSLYIPMSYWNVTYDQLSENVMIPEFVESDDGYRSYGYFFDEARTLRVPYSFVPITDVTLYAAFASYAEVAGTYYIETNESDRDTYVELDEHGDLYFVSGARTVQSTYTYDGATVYLLNTAIARVRSWTDEALQDGAENYYYNYVATVEDGVLTIRDSVFFTEGNYLTAVKRHDSFKYGDYYTSSGDIYSFYADGTGAIRIGTSVTKFTFTISADGKTIQVNRAGVSTGSVGENGEVQNVGAVELNAIDQFVGSWSAGVIASSFYKTYTFDGKGSWSYVYGRKTSDGVTELEKKNGTYTVSSEGVLSFDGRSFAIVNGALTEVGTTDKYYKNDKLAGVWTFNHATQPIEMTLYGLGANGVGHATLVYDRTDTVEATYEIINGRLYLFDGDFDVATLVYDEVNAILSGTVYAPVEYDGYNENAVFVAYDMFKGEWLTDIDGMETVAFNGLGAYDLKGGYVDKMIAVRGNVQVNGKNVGAYTVNALGQAVFTYDGVEYALTYDHARGILNASFGGNSGEFVPYDKLSGVTLVALNINTAFTFDGKGALSTGGALTVKKADGQESVFSYFIEGNGEIIVKENNDGALVDYCKIVNDDGYYAVSEMDGTIVMRLVEYSDFAGTWQVSERLDVIEIGYTRIDGATNGTYLGTEVTFSFDRESNLLTFEYNGSVMTVSYIDGGALVLGNESNRYLNIVCIPEGQVDEWMGEYDAVSGNGTLVLDGFGNNQFKSGSAIFKNANGRIENVYDYVIDDDGLVAVETARYTYSVLVECSSTDDGAYEINGKYYHLVETDELYWVTATAGEVTYKFNGLGKVVASDGEQYSYQIVAHEGKIITLVLTDEHGNEYDATLDYSNASKYVLEIDKI